MIEQILLGIKENIVLVGISLLMLIAGTIAAFKKHGIKRVLLGKSNEHLELIYKKDNGNIEWKKSIKVWLIIITGGMNILAVFLLILILFLAYAYQHDIKATRSNDDKLCKELGTVYVSNDQLEEYYAERENYGLDNIIIPNSNS